MIIMKIMGGLGNQLFQYAFGRYLSLSQGSELIIDISSYHNNHSRSFKLDYFKTKYVVGSEELLSRYTMDRGRFATLIRKYYRKMAPRRKWFFHSDIGDLKYCEELKSVRKGYFNGYWSNEAYFIEIKDQLKEELELKEEYRSRYYEELSAEIKGENSVALHVRHGDYVNNSDFNKVFNVLPKTYYSDAIEIMKSKLKGDIVFYVFSDNIQWARRNINVNGARLVFMDHPESQDYIDFSLMRCCNHFIMANSTFSWWAAWLSSSSDKLVIAPKQWYNPDAPKKFDSGLDFIPKSWILI